jgi:lysophospholipid acyltransferase (LPLAT)-like uncharacterized protein
LQIKSIRTQIGNTMGKAPEGRSPQHEPPLISKTLNARNIAAQRTHDDEAESEMAMTAEAKHAALRVDEVPLWLAPPFHAFGYGGGALFQALLELLRTTCTIERAPAQRAVPRIECLWHEHLPAYMATYLPPRDGLRYVWMNHPIWYMRPVHVVLGWNGVERLYLGSSGHGGQAALDSVVAALAEGYSTALAVDGPAGPAREAKRGALDMALRSGLPVVAIRFRYERAVRLGGWDRKWCPRPGSRIVVSESEPLYVNAENHEAQRMRLTAALSGDAVTPPTCTLDPARK